MATQNFVNPKTIALVLLALVLISWGTYGHERINRAAVLALPSPLQEFFFNHINFITQESSAPDLRRQIFNDYAEEPRHYFDLENYGPMDSIPQTLALTKMNYENEFLQKNGILLWHLEEMMEKLTKAFKDKRKSDILFLAANLGHYVADAHTPLHNTANFDGQLTNQQGIHSFWESHMLKMFGNQYRYRAGEVVYIQDIRKEIRNIIIRSNSLADSLLIIDRKLLDEFSKDIRNDSFQNRPTRTDSFALEYHRRLNGMIEKQINASITSTASFWYTAWVNAGKPNLSDLDPADQTKRNRKNLKRELKYFNKGKLLDVK